MFSNAAKVGYIIGAYTSNIVIKRIINMFCYIIIFSRGGGGGLIAGGRW